MHEDCIQCLSQGGKNKSSDIISHALMLFPSTRLSQSWTAGHIRNLEERLKEIHILRRKIKDSQSFDLYVRSKQSFFFGRERERERVCVFRNIERLFYQQKKNHFFVDDFLEREENSSIHVQNHIFIQGGRSGSHALSCPLTAL